jgi:hypothetical protein
MYGVFFNIYYLKITAMKTKINPASPDNVKPGRKLNAPAKAEELHTDFPLSEKDEVKQAEKRTNNGTKKPV